MQALKPQQQNNIYKITVAMFFAYKGVIPPQRWYHNPYLQDKYGKTVAMILIIQNVTVPDKWKHDYRIQDEFGFTIGMHLALQNRIYHEQWVYNFIDYTYQSITQNSLNCNKIVKLLLQQYQDIQYQDKDVRNFHQYSNKQLICDYCKQRQKRFLKTQCGDNICMQCYSKLVSADQLYFCPVCYQQQWLLFTADAIIDNITKQQNNNSTNSE